ncbi:hypothetical protein HAX54_004660 [Datura stramonium]|uniref:Uncharacterized protein n=1 Tax=Datura stramonium TaxID=4076 RepID=A0ABS8T8S4_DATST|nr:hypothetical protein [Datura stramonium]
MHAGGPGKTVVARDGVVPCQALFASISVSRCAFSMSRVVPRLTASGHATTTSAHSKQFKRNARQQATSMPYLILIGSLYMRANCPLFQPLDKTRRAEGVNTLATKRDKEAPVSKRPKLTSGSSAPLPTMPYGR